MDIIYLSSGFHCTFLTHSKCHQRATYYTHKLRSTDWTDTIELISFDWNENLFWTFRPKSSWMVLLTQPAQTYNNLVAHNACRGWCCKLIWATSSRVIIIINGCIECIERWWKAKHGHHEWWNISEGQQCGSLFLTGFSGNFTRTID